MTKALLCAVTFLIGLFTGMWGQPLWRAFIGGAIGGMIGAGIVDRAGNEVREGD